MDGRWKRSSIRSIIRSRQQKILPTMYLSGHWTVISSKFIRTAVWDLGLCVACLSVLAHDIMDWIVATLEVAMTAWVLTTVSFICLMLVDGDPTRRFFTFLLLVLIGFVFVILTLIIWAIVLCYKEFVVTRIRQEGLLQNNQAELPVRASPSGREADSWPFYVLYYLRIYLHE